MSSSDSEGEEDRLKFADCVYNLTPSAAKNPAVVGTTASNRYLPDESKHFDYRSVRVPEKVREYIGKHLDQILSDDTKFAELNQKKKTKKLTEPSTSIKLLNTCDAALDVDAVAPSLPVVKRKSKKDLSEKELERRAKLVVVEPEYILSQKEVAAWAPENRGLLEIVQTSKKRKKKPKRKAKIN